MRSLGHCFSIAAMLVASARPCGGKPRPGRCELTYKHALKLERDGALLEAQAELQSCARPACAKPVQHQCTVRYEQAMADTPSIVPTVTDADGAPVVDVKVTMDGDPLVSQIDGRAISIDPGLHEFAFERDEVLVATRRVVILQGQRNYPIAVKLQRAKKPPPLTVVRSVAPPAPKAPEPMAPLSELPTAEPRRPSMFGPYTLISTGLLALGGFGVLTYWGNNDNQKLAQCAPNCAQASIDHIRDLYLYANISLSAGIVAVVTGSVWGLRNHYTISVQPTTAGAYASIGGRF